MGSSEDYLDNLLKSALNEDQDNKKPNAETVKEPTGEIEQAEKSAGVQEEIPVIEPVEQSVDDSVPSPVSDNPNKTLSPDEIAEMFAAMEQAEKSSEIQEETKAEDEVPQEETEKAEDIPVIEPMVESVVEDSASSLVSDNPNRTLSPDEIAEMFATMGQAEQNNEDKKETKEISEPQEMEIDMDNPEELDRLLGIKEKPQKTEGNENDFLSEMGQDDEDLAEINELLRKSDNHEMVDDDIMSLLEMQADSKEESEKPSSEDMPEIPEKDSGHDKKVKREVIPDGCNKVLVPKWQKKKENSTDSETKLLDDDILQGRNDIEDFFQMAEKQQEAGAEEIPELADIKEKKKAGFFGRLFSALTEEAEEKEEIPEKKSKKKKSKVTDAEDNAGILAELDAEEEIKEKKGKKGKGEKPKKEKKKEKKKKEAISQEHPEPNGQLPKKMVIRIFVLCFSVLALLLIVWTLLPRITMINDARNAYYSKEYQTAYVELYGQKLNEADTKLLQSATIIMKQQRRYDSYCNYKALNMSLQALDALITGYGMYNEMQTDIQKYNVSDEVQGIHNKIIQALMDDYGVSEQKALELYQTEDSNTYTKELNEIIDSGKATTEGATVTENPQEETATNQLLKNDVLPEENYK